MAGDNHDPCCWLKNFPGPVATILIPYTLVIWHVLLLFLDEEVAYAWLPWIVFGSILGFVLAHC